MVEIINQNNNNNSNELKAENAKDYKCAHWIKLLCKIMFWTSMALYENKNNKKKQINEIMRFISKVTVIYHDELLYGKK